MQTEPKPSKKQREDVVIPIIKEEINIDKKQIETGKVQINTRVEEREVKVDITEASEDIQIERVAVNKIVTTEPAVRHEGDTMIIPVMKEEIVMEKKLVLVEEIRITRSKNEVTRPVRVTLREEKAEITRKTLDQDSSSTA